MKDNIPKAGDIIYIEGSLYLGHGEDDMVGGKALINSIEKDEQGDVWIILEILRSTRYNWRYLKKEQKKLKKEFGDTWAYSNPDIRPEFNKGE